MEDVKQPIDKGSVRGGTQSSSSKDRVGEGEGKRGGSDKAAAAALTTTGTDCDGHGGRQKSEVVASQFSLSAPTSFDTKNPAVQLLLSKLGMTTGSPNMMYKKFYQPNDAKTGDSIAVNTFNLATNSELVAMVNIMRMAGSTVEGQFYRSGNSIKMHRLELYGTISVESSANLSNSRELPHIYVAVTCNKIPSPSFTTLQVWPAAPNPIYPDGSTQTYFMFRGAAIASKLNWLHLCDKNPYAAGVLELLHYEKINNHPTRENSVGLCAFLESSGTANSSSVQYDFRLDIPLHGRTSTYETSGTAQAQCWPMINGIQLHFMNANYSATTTMVVDANYSGTLHFTDIETA